MVGSTRVEEQDRERLEREVRSLCERGDHTAAATLTIRAYGPELLGFLVAVHRGARDDLDATECFSELCEVLWRRMPSFAWESSLRTWSYGVARNVSRTRKRDAARRGRRVAGGDSVLEGVAQAVRTETLSYLRTEKRSRLAALRDRLDEEDRMLLILRVDRKLEWNELARVLGSAAGHDAPDSTAIAREAARLRKRFQLVKDRLREIARREKLVE
jgi:RNA polymerase sigma-70 factor (ECF subfamily)